MKLSFKIVFVLMGFTLIFGFSENHRTPMYFDIPKGFPEPIYNFKNNPLSKEGFELGRKLFYDPILSKDSTISCASCHLQQTGFAHVDHDLSHGIEGRIGTRNALTLQNLAWSSTFMYDGGVNNLDVQAILPITSHMEMDETFDNVVAKLQKTNDYPILFENAFGTQKITGQFTLKALSQFVVCLTSANSKYDKVTRGEAVFSEMEQKGYVLFKNNCASCHTEPLLTSKEFKNNGLPIDETLNDYGRMLVTQSKKDALKFKVPTLRNIEFTFPYMHDGRFKNLNEVLKHYNSLDKKSNTLSNELKKSKILSDNERTELIAFLKTLTDSEFLFNEKYAFPKNK